MASLAAAAVVSSLAGCRPAGPTYQRPDAATSPAWDVPPPWRPSDPKDTLPRGDWWKVFNDDALTTLEATVLVANQNVWAAEARFEQARAIAAIAYAGKYPTIESDKSVSRDRLSGNRPGTGAPGVAVTQSNVLLPFTASYEVDLFGRRSRSIEAAQASLQASAADRESVRLLMTASMARDYFALSQIDAEIDVLDKAVQSLERGLQLVQARHDGGLASGLDVAQEETLLNATAHRCGARPPRPPDVRACDGRAGGAVGRGLPRAGPCAGRRAAADCDRAAVGSARAPARHRRARARDGRRQRAHRRRDDGVLPVGDDLRQRGAGRAWRSARSSAPAAGSGRSAPRPRRRSSTAAPPRPA